MNTAQTQTQIQQLTDLANTLRQLIELGPAAFAFMLLITGLAIVVFGGLYLRGYNRRANAIASTESAREKFYQDLWSDLKVSYGEIVGISRQLVKSQETSAANEKSSAEMLASIARALDASTQTMLLIQAALRQQTDKIDGVDSKAATIIEHQDTLEGTLENMHRDLNDLKATLKDTTGNIADLQRLMQVISNMDEKLSVIVSNVLVLNEKVRTKELPVVVIPPVQELPPQVQQ